MNAAVFASSSMIRVFMGVSIREWGRLRVTRT
jgi:hypothetical protein